MITVFASIVNRFKPNATLRLTFPCGKTPALALALLALVWGLAEGVARAPQTELQDTFSSVGSSDADFDRHVAALDYQAASGPIECIVLGSSMVLSGFSPNTFTEVYRDETHTHLSCANFGVSGLEAWQMADVARLLVQRYHPRLLIVGTSARDYSDPVGDLWLDSAGDLTQTPWVRYQLGRGLSPEGWLTEHSYAFRYWLGARNWVRASGQPAPGPHPVIDLTQPPDRRVEGASYDLLAHYQISPRSLAGLNDLLTLPKQGVPVLLVEMVVHASYLAFFGRGQQDQDLFRATVAQAARAHGVAFLPADPTLPLPNADWSDRNHLGAPGAAVFSAWLARQVALAAQAGQFDLGAH